MKEYWLRESQSLNRQGKPIPGTCSYDIIQGQGPKAVVVESGTGREWALERTAELNLHGDHEQLKKDFAELLDLTGRLAYELDSMTQNITHTPTFQKAKRLIDEAHELSYKHKKAGKA